MDCAPLLCQSCCVRGVMVISREVAALGHAKLETTSLYTRVATNTIRTVMSPLDRLTPLRAARDEPPA